MRWKRLEGEGVIRKHAWKVKNKIKYMYWVLCIRVGMALTLGLRCSN